MQKPLVQFRGVCKSLGKKEVLQNINFDIFPKEIFGIIGSSGAGKTTLLRTLIGFYRLDKGDIIYNGQSVSQNLRLVRSVMGFATQDNCIYDELTALENLEYFGRMHQAKDIKKNSLELLKLVDLWDNRNVVTRHLSGGMQRRLDLACSLIHKPSVLIMDEPTQGLDPLLRKKMWHLIRAINARGTTIVVSSHLLEEIEHVCSRVGIVSKGKLLVVGTPDQLKDMYSKNEEIHLETFPGRYSMIIRWLQSQNVPITYYSDKGHKLILYTPQAETVLHYILHLLEQMKERLLDVEVNKPSLNEVFEAFARYNKDAK